MKFAILAFALLHIAIASSVESKGGLDPKEFVTINGKQYYFSPPESTGFANSSARFCNDLGMALVSFETVEEHDAIIDYMKTSANGVFWTSGHGYMDNWIWTGTGRLWENLSWAPGGPHDPSGCLCVFIGIYGMFDQYCHSSFRFICE